jgi:hypothetical protein
MFVKQKKVAEYPAKLSQDGRGMWGQLTADKLRAMKLHDKQLSPAA